MSGHDHSWTVHQIRWDLTPRLQERPVIDWCCPKCGLIVASVDMPKAIIEGRA